MRVQQQVSIRFRGQPSRTDQTSSSSSSGAAQDLPKVAEAKRRCELGGIIAENTFGVDVARGRLLLL
jgi:hypothetical protein